jgi:sugar lactone lactonase YvrE
VGVADAGAVVGVSHYVKNPVAVTQDHRLRLIVCAEVDTVVGGQAATFGALYRLDLPAAGHDIARAVPRLVYVDLRNAQRRYTGAAVLADNSYYVTRSGPDNASIIDPDDAVMLFDAADAPQPRVSWPALAVDGSGLTAITRPTAVATFPRPGTDFVFTQQGAASLFRAQWITLRTTGDVAQWESYFTPARDGAVDFLRVGLFSAPEDVTVDASGNIFVVDAAKDSVFRFSPSGFITQAFGGASQFRAPRGVASFDKTLYVADTGNDRILRFILSTDMQ